VVHCGLAATAGVAYGGAVGVRALTSLTVLHALRTREPYLSPSLKVESSSLGDSSRMACSEGILLWIMPPNRAPGLALTGYMIQVVEVVSRHLERTRCRMKTHVVGSDGEFM
jgi:hypothetical protein